MIEANDNTLLSTHSPHHNDSVAPPMLSDEPHSDEHESVTITNDFEDPLPRSASKSNVTVDTAFGGVYDHTSSTFEHTAHRHSLSMSRSLTTSRDSSHDDADDDNDEQTTDTPGAVSSPTQHTSNDAVSSTPNYHDDASQHSALSESEHDQASHSDSSTTTATTSRPKVRTRRRSTYQWKHKQQQPQQQQGDEQVNKETSAKKRGRRRSRRLSQHDTVSPHTSALTTAKVRTKVARRRSSDVSIDNQTSSRVQQSQFTKSGREAQMPHHPVGTLRKGRVQKVSLLNVSTPSLIVCEPNSPPKK